MFHSNDSNVYVLFECFRFLYTVNVQRTLVCVRRRGTRKGPRFGFFEAYGVHRKTTHRPRVENRQNRRVKRFAAEDKSRSRGGGVPPTAHNKSHDWTQAAAKANCLVKVKVERIKITGWDGRTETAGGGVKNTRGKRTHIQRREERQRFSYCFAVDMATSSRVAPMKSLSFSWNRIKYRIVNTCANSWNRLSFISWGQGRG